MYNSSTACCTASTTLTICNSLEGRRARPRRRPSSCCCGIIWSCERVCMQFPHPLPRVCTSRNTLGAVTRRLLPGGVSVLPSAENVIYCGYQILPGTSRCFVIFFQRRRRQVDSVFASLSISSTASSRLD